MKAIMIGSRHFGRLEKGEEIVSSLTAYCRSAEIKNGTVIAIGAAEKLKLGFYDTENKKYSYKHFPSEYEITTLMGNISLLENELFIHLHINISDEDFHTYGGHLFEGYISITCEFVIEAFETAIERKLDEVTGLYLISV